MYGRRKESGREGLFVVEFQVEAKLV